jgi:hypothetical protein
VSTGEPATPAPGSPGASQADGQSTYPCVELTRVLGFAGVSLALIAVPGPSLIYIVIRSVSQGTRAGRPRPDRSPGWSHWSVAAIYLGLGTYAALFR